MLFLSKPGSLFNIFNNSLDARYMSPGKWGVFILYPERQTSPYRISDNFIVLGNEEGCKSFLKALTKEISEITLSEGSVTKVIAIEDVILQMDNPDKYFTMFGVAKPPEESDEDDQDSDDS